MKINLTKQQYRNLLKVFYLGEWMINGFKIDEDQEINSLEQHLFSFAGAFDCDDWVEQDEKSNLLYPRRETEEYMDQFLDEYSNLNFWNEMIQRLADRDFYSSIPEEELSEMETFERIHQIDEIAGKYEEEFRKNQLKNVCVKIK